MKHTQIQPNTYLLGDESELVINGQFINKFTGFTFRIRWMFFLIVIGSALLPVFLDEVIGIRVDFWQYTIGVFVVFIILLIWINLRRFNQEEVILSARKTERDSVIVKVLGYTSNYLKIEIENLIPSHIKIVKASKLSSQRIWFDRTKTPEVLILKLDKFQILQNIKDRFSATESDLLLLKSADRSDLEFYQDQMRNWLEEDN